MTISRKQLFALAVTLLLSLFAYSSYSPSPLTPSQQRLLAINYTTTSTRSDAVNLFCTDLTRSTLVDAELSSQYTVFSAQMDSMFSLDGNSYITNMINGNTAQAQAELQNSSSQIVTFVGPFVIGLGLILILSPFILCCCACPFNCPPKCCRKNQDEQYTLCELYWPVAVLVLALLLCIGACIAGFSQSETIPQAMTSTSCATSIIFDDLLNGNVTQDGSSFFLGLRQLDTQLGHLNTNLTTINNSMSNIKTGSANISAVTTAGSTALTNTAKIPNNVDAGGNMTDITYNTPLNSGSPTGTITSTFPSALGSSTTGGYVGTLYTRINSVITTINAIATAANNFVTQVSSFSAAVGSLQTTVQNFTTFMVDLDSSLFTTLKNLDSKNGDIHIGVRLVYGLTIAVASTMLLGALLVAFCDKIKCRYLIYGSCVVLFFIGVAGFALSVFFSLLVPGVYFGCQFMNTSLSSSVHFNNNFGNIITDTTIRGYVSTCLSTSTGDLMTALGGGAVNAVNNLSSSITGISNMNITQESASVQADLTSLTNAITNYQTGVVNDITDTSSIAIITTLSQASSYSGCTTPAFASDSWIPSTSQSPVYSACQINGGNNATGVVCSGANFAAASGGCDGCMDTTSILNTATYGTKASVLTALNNRYSAGGCSTFNNEMANTWANYYKIKSDAFTPISSRMSTATTSVNQFSANLTGTLSTTFTTAVNSMNAVAQTVTDGKYGLVAGLNCRLIGEDFSTFTNTFCQNFFTVSYFARLAIGCASFGILFSICFGACTGVRFYKNSIRKLNSVENQGLSEDQVQDITNHNFVKPKVLE